MSFRKPRDILIACEGCKIENVFSDYVPATVIVCTQCRERLLWPHFNDTHHEYLCGDCGFSICLLKSTPFEEGNTPCRCGSLNLNRISPSPIAAEAEAAGAFSLTEEDGVQDTDAGFDWFRSEPKLGSSDYNEMFDQDPGHN